MDEKEQRKLERKIFRTFLKSKEFSDFEKDSLKVLKSALFAAYSFYREGYFEYLMENQEQLDAIINSFNHDSKIAIESLLKDAEYVSTHNFIDLLQNLLNNRESIMRHLERVNSYRYLKLHANLYEQSVFDYHHGLIYLPQETLNELKGKDFIDCGAYIGDSALIFETFYNPRKVYAFEPDPENYNYMVKTIEINDLKKVEPLNLGVGDTEEKVNFFHMSSASHIISDNSNSKVQITSIDKYMAGKDLNVGLIKMDVEGFELQALKGAKKTIEQFKPVLSLSIYHNAEQFIDVINYVQNLDLDYHIIIRHLSDFVPIAETYLIAW